jgi:hypothetical protein
MKVLGFCVLLAGAALVYSGYKGKTLKELFAIE